MKVLITGGSGLIGGECIKQCLSHPSISTVVTFGRRNLSGEIADHPKLKQVIIEDFAKLPRDVLEEHADAAGMIWAMGSYKGSQTADFDYPLAFLDSMARVLESKPGREPFKYIQLSGKFTRGDQNMKLWWGERPRKLKGLCDVKVLEFASSHKDLWRITVIKPGGVATETITGTRLGAAIMGPNWCVLIEELGAYMTFLVVDGEGESDVVENHRIVMKGREILKSQRRPR